MTKVKGEEETKSNWVECYYCGGHVPKDMVATFKVPVESIKPYLETQEFHYDCLPKFIKENGDLEAKKIEYTEWEKLALYFQYHILGLGENSKLSKHAVLRLLGLRVGQYMPKKSNVRVVKRGYSYETILNTMKYSKRATDNAFATVEIKDEQHKINLALSIVSQNLNFIDQRMKAIKKQNERTEQIEIKEVPRAKYVRKGDRKAKMALFADLFDEE